MKNGDRLNGTIIKKDGATLTIKTANFGLLTTPWAQVASIATDAPVTVVTKNPASFAGKLAPAPESGQILVAGKALPAADVTALRNADEEKLYQRMNQPRLTDLWAMTSNIGLAGTIGNARAMTLTVPVNFTRVTANDSIAARFNFIHSSAKVNGVNSETAEAIRGGWTYNRNLDHSKLFASLGNDFEYDKFQNLDLRATAGGGLGWHARKMERGFLDLVSGVDYNHEAFHTLTRSLAEFYWGDSASIKWNKRVTLTQSYRMFSGISGTGFARQNADVIWSAALSKRLTWNATLSERYLSDPPGGIRKNDFLYSTGFGIKLAR